MDAAPLGSVDELWNYSPPSNLSIEPLRNFTPQLTDRPEVLVCHDMMGGYLPHEEITGCSTSVSRPFVFLNYWQIDYFCYFSHNFITIPPQGWIEAAHRHGVRVLGTLITEGDGGKNLCRKFLAGPEAIDKTVDALVELAKAWNFEGYLINIENELEKPLVSMMYTFLSKLTDSLHKAINFSKVFWYDAVVHSGKLIWQNALNDQNYIFYQSCDGIYLNYGWNYDDLEETLEKNQALTLPTKNIFVGVDVFGRGCVGGWQCWQSFEIAQTRGLSVAVFAPGWVVEAHSEKNDVTRNGLRFWNLLRSCTPLRPITELPMKTNFSAGFSADGDWWCLSKISVQPHWPLLAKQMHPITKGDPGLRLDKAGIHRIFKLETKVCNGDEVLVYADSIISVLVNGSLLQPKNETDDPTKIQKFVIGFCETRFIAKYLEIETRNESVIIFGLEINPMKI